MPELDTQGAICQTCGFLMKPEGADEIEPKNRDAYLI
jgi:hypothetical protein